MFFFFLDVLMDGINQWYGYELTSEIIQQSVMDTCDFFHLEEPAFMMESEQPVCIQT